MNFKGGILIVGSLIWDKSPVRTKWRKLCLNTDEARPTPVKIGYGRRSSTREDTYSIIFSNHPETKTGQGLIVPLKNEIKNFRQLEKQAFALASAEGIWKQIEEPKIYAGWGTIGILINPDIDKKDEKGAKLIKERWSRLYEVYNDYSHTDYINSTSDPVIIDENGFLQLQWTEQMNEFDFLLATPVKPRPKRLLTPDEVANKMNEKEYFEYFQNNCEFGILTFQDDEIKNKIKPAANKK